MSNFDDIKSCYVNILQREPSEDEVLGWEAPVNSGALKIEQVRQAFINSAEGQAVHAVVRMYQAAFGRVPDKEGLKTWVNSGLSTEEIADGFVNSLEFTNRYGNNKVSEAFVTSLYYQVLGRAPDAEGLTNWTKSGLSAAQILAGFSDSQEFKNTSSVAVSTFLDDAGKGTQSYEGGLFDGTPEVEIPGQSFTMTVNVDTIVGTELNDTINGLLDIDGIKTVNALDSIDGGAGVDTLNLSIGSNSALPTSATIKNIEIVNLISDGGVLTGRSGPIDASRFVGAEQIWQVDDANGITKLGANTVAGFQSIATDDDMSVETASGVTSVSIALDEVSGDEGNVVSLAVGGNALNSVLVDGTIVNPADYTGEEEASLDLSVKVGKDVQTLTVNSIFNTALSVDDEGSTKKLSTLDAGSSTGGITYVAGSNVSSITTGTGNDDVAISFATAKATSSVAAKDASVYTADGDDKISVATTGSGTTKIDAGHGDNTVDVEGNDNVDAKLEVISGDGKDVVGVASGKGTVSINTGNGADDITIGSGYKAAEVMAGNGDDIVHVMDGEGYRTLTDSDSLDGGDGYDTIVVAGAETFESGDYVRLSEVSNFEHLRFEGTVGYANDKGDVFALDASELTNFSHIEVAGDMSDEGDFSYVGNLSNEQTVIAHGVVFVEAEDVATVQVNDIAGLAITAKSADVTVDATKNVIDPNGRDMGGAKVYIGSAEGDDSFPSDIESATINLVSKLDEESGDMSGAAEAHVVSHNAGEGFTSLTIEGVGYAYVNNELGKLTSIDASGLEGTNTEGRPLSWFEFYGEESVKEDIKLSTGFNEVHVASRAGNSSLDKMDTVTGFKLVMDEAGTSYAEGSDILDLGISYQNPDRDGANQPGDEFWGTAAGFKTTATEFEAFDFTSEPLSLGAAINTVSRLADNAVVFKFEGDSYVYVENEAATTTLNGDFEASDMLVKLAGISDIDGLAKAASLQFSPV
ncbi:hypothetical protein GGE65_000773 [Skermanella aerolata]|uniref:DUF4214 domain-containing protein n=1 Tax=Skermanella aerolata TaxID=393310 RepID=UPI003D1E7ADE